MAKDYMKSIGILLLMALSFFTVACERKADLSESERQERHYQMIQEHIHHNRLAEAEREILNTLEQNADDVRANVLYASLYLRKANITIQDYFKIHQAFSADVNVEELGFLNNNLRVSLDEKRETSKDIEMLLRLNELYGASSYLDRQLGLIPEIDRAQAGNLYQALLKLENLDADMDSGDRLFRGTIKLIYFKFLWRKEVFFPTRLPELCGWTLQQWTSKIDIVRSYLPLMIEDVSFGLPKNQERMMTTANDIRRSSDEFKKVIVGLLTGHQQLNQVLQAAGAGGVLCTP